MGILSVVHACSHLQNASRARLALTSIPVTKYNLNLCLALHRAGYISSITRGGVHPPETDAVLDSVPAPAPWKLEGAGDVARGKSVPDFQKYDTPSGIEPLTHANVAKSRLWIGLKYWDGKPVMQNVSPVSTPKRKVQAKLEGLERMVRGLPWKAVPGLTLGESLFLTTDVGVLEAREAIERHRGGMLLCRAS